MAGKRNVDFAEEPRIEKFYKDGCCNKNCYLKFTREKVAEFRNDILELEEKERDMMIMGFLFSQKVESGESMDYCIHGIRVCRTKNFQILVIKEKFASILVHAHFRTL